MDEASLDRVLDLLEYMRRESAAKFGKQEHSAPVYEAWAPPTEKQAMDDMASMQSVFGGVNAIPQHLREAIAWAEDEKMKRGIA